MLNIKKPTVVTVLDVTLFGSDDPKCDPTMIVLVADKDGVKRRIYLSGNKYKSLLTTGNTVVVQEQRLMESKRFFSEYIFWQYNNRIKQK